MFVPFVTLFLRLFVDKRIGDCYYFYQKVDYNLFTLLKLCDSPMVAPLSP